MSALAQPNPPLTDGRISLAPLTQADLADALAMCDDEETRRFTFLPTDATAEWISNWLRRYEEGWADASRAGFSIRDAQANAYLGFAAIVRLDLPNRQGEIGYVVSPEARGRGAASAAVEILTRWGFDELGLLRLELRIDTDNPASARVAERAGYRLDGVLRSLAFKDGRRTDTAVWSRLASD
ncbi:MAG TPA: GNAT family protein [Gaiellaceae bacterium]|nr:GNAT family protein [Gaiellaceae bacterium]